MKKPKSQLRMQLIAVIFCVFPALICLGARGQVSKPKLRVAADGFPSGHDTPEGAACDLARAYINRDEKLFSATCLRVYGGGKGRAEYADFLDGATKQIRTEATKKQPSPDVPKTIYKVFAARHLRMSGPASYGYAVFGFEDVMFVDVGVYLQNGERYLHRTMVIKDSDGKWYVHPDPSASPLLSAGLNEEKASVLDIADVYELVGGPPKLAP